MSKNFMLILGASIWTCSVLEVPCLDASGVQPRLGLTPGYIRCLHEATTARPLWLPSDIFIIERGKNKEEMELDQKIFCVVCFLEIIFSFFPFLLIVLTMFSLIVFDSMWNILHFCLDFIAKFYIHSNYKWFDPST